MQLRVVDGSHYLGLSPYWFGPVRCRFIQCAAHSVWHSCCSISSNSENARECFESRFWAAQSTCAISRFGQFRYRFRLSQKPLSFSPFAGRVTVIDSLVRTWQPTNRMLECHQKKRSTQMKELLQLLKNFNRRNRTPTGGYQWMPANFCSSKTLRWPTLVCVSCVLNISTWTFADLLEPTNASIASPKSKRFAQNAHAFSLWFERLGFFRVLKIE